MTGRIDVRAYRLPLAVTYRWAKGAHGHRAGAIVRVEAAGAVGWGEIAFGPHVEVDGPALERQVEDLVSGLDPDDADFIAALDGRGGHNRIRAGIVTALFAARATAAGQPLNRYLGRLFGIERMPADAVPINGLVGATTIEGALGQCAGYAADGMSTFKIKCFDDVDADVERVGAIRSAYPDAALRLDPNDAWKTVDAAVRNLERFAPLGIAYVEDPLDTHHASLDEMAEVRRRSPVPVAWDNPVNGVEAMERLLEREAADVFVFKMPRAGGPDRQIAMIRLAERAGVPGVMTDPIETGVGMLASLHVTTLCPPPIADSGFSLSGHYARDLVPVPPIEDGKRRLPGGVGLGVDPSRVWSDGAAALTPALGAA